MRFPHRVKFIDVRNRQPPQGVAYDAAKYDVIQVVNANEPIPDIDRGDDAAARAYLNANNVEPEGTTSPEIDVAALITAADDGDRNLDAVRLNIRVPMREIARVRKFFDEKRKESINNYGYKETFEIENRYINLGLFQSPSTFGASISSALGSGLLNSITGINYLTMAASDDDSGILSDLVSESVAQYDIDSNLTPQFLGLLPPVREWQTPNSFDRRFIAGYLYSVYVDLGPGYIWKLQITRVDRYPDMMSFRIIVPGVRL